MSQQHSEILSRIYAATGCTGHAEVLEAHPYFASVAALHLSDAEETDAEMLARAAVAFGNRQDLCALVGEGALSLTNFYPEEPKPVTPDTITTIDSFLDRFAGNDAHETEVLSQILFNPTPQYADVLAAEERKRQEQNPEESKAVDMDDRDRRISEFIARQDAGESIAQRPVAENPAEKQQKVQAPADTLADAMLSESLAKIYIRQHKYSKALEIIKTLSLNFPEKSIYFADQIRFLRKLVYNEKIKNNKK